MVTVITGASKGIGFALAGKFIQEGSHIAICARNSEELDAARLQLQQLAPQACILALPTDMQQREQVQRFATAIFDTFSQIDVLINNAGRFLPGDISTEPDGTLETLIETNLYSAYHLTRSLLPRMMQARQGHIINISSVAGLKAYTQGGSYSISKYALEGFSHNLREELKPYGIKVTTVNPGATMSDSWKGSGVQPERIMQASDIAHTIWSLTQLSPQAVVEQIVLRPQLGDL